MELRGRVIAIGEEGVLGIWSNVFTTRGKWAIAQYVVDQADYPRYIAVGTDNTAPDASDSQLGAEVFRTRIVGSLQSAKDKVWYLAKFDQRMAAVAGQSAIALKEAGLFDKGGNLLTNGDMEDWTDWPGSPNLPTGWTGYGIYSPAGVTTKSRAAIQEGSFSLGVRPSYSMGTIWQKLETTAYNGKDLMFRAWIKSSVGGANVQISDSTISSHTSSRHTGDGTWQLLSVKHTVGSSATWVQASITFPRDPNGLVHIDNCELFEMGTLWARASIDISKDITRMIALVWELKIQRG
jgi:hypothetical protein